MEKLSLITDEISQDFEYVLDLALEFGIKGVDVREAWNKNIVLFNDEELAKMKAALDKRGMKINVITGPLAKCVFPSSRLSTSGKQSLMRNPDYNLGLFDRMVEISDFFQTPYIRIFTFLYLKSEVTEKKWKEMMELLRPIVQKAEKLGKILLLENEFECAVASIKQTKRFFEEMNSKAIKLLLDPGNYYVFGDSINPEDYEYFYKKNWVEYLHIKDPIKKYLNLIGIFKVVGEGKIDYRSIFEQAFRYGIKGSFSLETHCPKDKELISRKSLENMAIWIKECS